MCKGIDRPTIMGKIFKVGKVTVILSSDLSAGATTVIIAYGCTNIIFIKGITRLPRYHGAITSLMLLCIFCITTSIFQLREANRQILSSQNDVELNLASDIIIEEPKETKKFKEPHAAVDVLKLQIGNIGMSSRYEASIKGPQS